MIPFTGIGAAVWQRYFYEQHKFLQKVAKETETNVFTSPQKMRINGVIADGGILLRDKYFGAVDLMLSSQNAGAHPLGGQAGIYVQHKIDNGIATSNNVNSGIRVQTETSQRRSAAQVNDVVGGYFGVRNNGVDVGGFGLHVDAYSNGSGANTTMYGMSVEMYRESAAGWTAAFHARSITATGYQDNDYAFLASPSVGGARRFRKIFSGGAAETGTMNCDYGLDLAFADCAVAAIRINELQPIVWDGAAEQILQAYDPIGIWNHEVSGVVTFGLENTGRVYIVANGNTLYNMSSGPSGDYLAINIGGTVYKIALDNF